MDELRSRSESSPDEIRSLQRTVRILLVIILILVALSLTLGYCSYSCINEPKCPVETPTETSLPVITLPPQQTHTPTKTPTPDLNATATAACSQFMDQFPGTPCP